MKKKKLLYKVKAYFFLVLFVFQTIFPTVSYGLTGDSTQPDFGAFEPFNTTDMVDLVSGDFTYNIPVLNVPSPEGGFQMPLSYHAGIELDEESSWVGLGWSMNPGVMERNVSMFPDDFNSEVSTTNVTNPGGSGYVQNYLIYTKYFDSEKGKGGTVKLGDVHFGWGTQKHFGISLIGTEYRNGEFKADVEGFTKSLTTHVSNLATYYGGPIGVAMSSAYSVASTIMAVEAAANAMKPTYANGWNTETSVDKKGFLGFGKKIAYKWYLNQTTQHSQYGTLYLGNVPHYDDWPNNNSLYISNGSNQGQTLNNSADLITKSYSSPNPPPTSDMYMNYNPSAGSYHQLVAPTSLAYDNYTVKSGGISGSIAPYRLDVGSFSNPVLTTDIHLTASISSYLNNYKVPFKYAGDISNTYNYPTYGSIHSPNFAFDAYYNDNSAGTRKAMEITALSNKFYDQKVSGYNQSLKKEANRTGLFNNNLVHGRHIEWFANEEIHNNNYAVNRGFMEGGSKFNRSGLPSKGIGGFAITREDGLTYHFSIPVYNNYEFNRFHTSPNGGTDYRVSNDNKYATMWLLTAITGTDFVDRGTIGVVDDSDWGYWVKFDYGKFAEHYTWRMPYHGYSLTGSDNYSYKRGERQTYYLNKISTRTHTALFSKSYKSDGKGFHDSWGGDIGDGVRAEPSSTLKLDDVYVLDNESYNKLITPTASGGMGLAPDFNSNQGNATIKNGDTYNAVLDNYDISSTLIQNYLKNNQLNKIHFNYSYSLCNKTLNSFDFESNGDVPVYDSDVASSTDLNKRKGKLTLESVEFLGKQDSKMMPSYVFNYGNTSSLTENPNYDIYKWDDWNMYNPRGSGLTSGHEPGAEGAEWSLKKITTPLGSEIEVDYERDEYNYVNGILKSSLITSNVNFYTDQLTLNNYVSGLIIGDIITITAQIRDYSWNAGGGQSGSAPHYEITGIRTLSKNVSISAINNGLINLSPNLKSLFALDNSTPSPTHEDYSVILSHSVNYNGKTLTGVPNYGGGLRVKDIKINDENGNQYITKYDYTKDGLETGLSSGVCSYEPEHVPGRVDYGFYKLHEHPITPIMYSKVTVTRGGFQGVFNETDKAVYRFTTPHANMINANGTVLFETGNTVYESGSIWQGHLWFDNYNGRAAFFTSIDKSSKIGNLDTITSINSKGQVISKTVYEYGDNSDNYFGNNMGIYSETSMLCEHIKTDHNSDYSGFVTRDFNYYLDRLYQTSKVKYPNILKSVTSYQNGVTSKQEFKNYDFYTGRPLNTIITIGNQDKYETVVVPTYSMYPALSSKALNIANKNIMVEPTASYSYVYDQQNNKKLLSASVTTWTNILPVRQYHVNFYNGYQTTSNYYDYTNASPYKNVYLPFQSFRWKSLLDNDGTIKNSDFVNYNYNATTQNSNWIKTSEATLYDHYSKILESKDINGNKSSIKYGYNYSYAIGGQSNSIYGGWCYSGAEDKSNDPNYFEGEVSGLTTQFASTSFAHTGNYSSKCLSNQFGFGFRGVYGVEFDNSTYRASVWVHQSNAQDAVLYCTIKNYGGTNLFSGQTKVNDPGVVHIGNWFLFNLDVKMSAYPSGYFVEFGTRNSPSASSTGGPVYFDDFRVHKASTPLTSSVYDSKTGFITAILDGENYATKFVYDNAGKVTATFKETKQGVKQVSKTEYNYSR